MCPQVPVEAVEAVACRGGGGVTDEPITPTQGGVEESFLG